MGLFYCCKNKQCYNITIGQFQRLFKTNQQGLCMAIVNGEDGFTQLDKLNITEKFLIKGLSVTGNRLIAVNSVEDLPEAVDGVITLEPNTEYKFCEVMSIPDRLIMQDGTTLSGTGALSTTRTLTYTGTDNFITSTNANINLHDLSIEAPNANQIFNCTGTTLQSVFIYACLFAEAPKLGTITGSPLVINNVSCIRFSDGWSFAGSPIVGLSVVNLFMQDDDGAAVHFNWGSAVFLDFEVLNVIMAGTGTCFSSDIGGANMTGGLEAAVNNCTFGVTGTMTPLNGYADDFQTNQWNFFENSPVTLVENSTQAGEIFLNGTDTVAINTSGVFEEIGAPTTGAWDSDLLKRFTASADGVLTYTGDKPISLQFIATASIEATAGSDELEGRLAVNWTAGQTGLFKTRSVTDNSRPTTITMIGEAELSQGDNVRVILTNNTDTTNINVTSATINVFSIRT